MIAAVPALVSTDWLAQHLDDPDLVVVDASFHLPTMNRDARAEFEATRIPGARFFDVDAIKDAHSDLPHMIPDETGFERAMEALGISDTSVVVAYDVHGLFSAARAWWLLRLFNHYEVAVLDGGLKKWLAEGRATESGPAEAPRPGRFTATIAPARVRKLPQMRDISIDKTMQILDARPPGRFAGSEPEPRPGLPSGHIPGSINLPFQALTRDDGTVKSPGALARLFAEAGVDLDRPVVTTCGSGISACNLTFALHLLGHEDAAVYDGSWAEWGADPTTRKAP